MNSDRSDGWIANETFHSACIFRVTVSKFVLKILGAQWYYRKEYENKVVYSEQKGSEVKS
jgi:hypothetical protein